MPDTYHPAPLVMSAGTVVLIGKSTDEEAPGEGGGDPVPTTGQIWPRAK